MENKLPPRFIVSKKPKEYLVQGLGHCGVYAVKGVLSAFDKDNKKNPEDYHDHWFRRIIGSTRPPDLIKILKSYDLEVTSGTVINFSSEQKLNFLKKQLFNNSPILLLISNGYLPSGRYSSLMAKLVSHWITLYGYDNCEEIFYVYDSAVRKNVYDKDMPVGNKKRKYSEVLRDWKTPFYCRLWSYWYIAVSKI